MDNNDLLRRLRYALRCDDAETSRLIQLGGGSASTRLTGKWRIKEGEDGYQACHDENILEFLRGLIIDKRGPREEEKPSPWPQKNASAPVEKLDNNVVLKQLRIALSLRSDDVHAILKAGGSALSASEAGALFRKPDARNYRTCGDQVLRQFIAGLVKQREREESKDQSQGEA